MRRPTPGLGPLSLLSVFTVCVWLVAAGCAPPGDSGEGARDPAADRQAVIDAHQALVDAYAKGDVDAVVLLLDKSDDLLIFHPRVDDRWDGIDEVQRNLGAMFERTGQVSWLDAHLDLSIQSDVAWITSQVIMESPGIEVPFTGRATEIWMRRGESWRLIHAHWSGNPEY